MLSTPKFNHSSKALRWTLATAAFAMVVVGFTLLYLLMEATNNREMDESTYSQLFTVNVVVASILLLIIAWVAYRLLTRLRQGRFGSRLMIKLAAIFALVGLAPGVLIYVVSYQFVSRSIESWFDVKVEGALEAGLNLGRVTLDTLSSDLSTKARTAAAQIAESPDPSGSVYLDRVLEQLSAADISVWSAQGNLLASAGESRYLLQPNKPTATQMRTAKTERSASWIEGIDELNGDSATGAYVKVLVPITSSFLGLTPNSKYLLVSRQIPPNLVANALAVDRANREYQERALGRKGLQRMYIGTLTLSLFFAVFGAILLAIVMGDQIARPLLTLAQGVSQVAAGDLTPKLALKGNDELVGLTRAFATMTEQVADARRAVQTSMDQVDAARGHLQTILDNLTSGVMVLSDQGIIQSVNPGAARILNVSLADRVGVPLKQIAGLEAFGQFIQIQFDEFVGNELGRKSGHWQRSFELATNERTAMSPFDRTLTLVVRGAELPSAQRLLVLDDISDIISAQRAQAWGEVARRLAHEIKNPLTPIQLSAERLERRLSGKLAAADQAVLNKSVATIVDQVEAMKRLVNDFRDYARLPSAELKAIDLNALILDVLHLYDSDAQHTSVFAELDDCAPKVLGDAQQLRQVIHNLIQNAQDACDTNHNPVHGAHRIVVRTQSQTNSGRIRLMVLDSGGGFPEHILKMAFEPYVTTKSKGTGLGLAVVKKIADEHGARVEIANQVAGGITVGAQVSLSLAAAIG